MIAFNWGILGTGNIARSMAEALGKVPGAQRHAVASRTYEKAQDFATRWEIPNAYGSYDELLSDPKVGIVYVATPNACHKDDILCALSAGKHVLCEKPMTLSAHDSETCFDAAEKAGLCLAEALWTAYFPAMQKAVYLVRSGAIGSPQLLSASFVSYRDPVRYPNLFDPSQGGGARNDLGIYPVSAALLMAGPVSSATSETIYGPYGVDEMVAMTLRHEAGSLSQLTFGFRLDLPIALKVIGTCGMIELPEDFHRPRRFILRKSTDERVFDLPPIGTGYAHEAIAFQKLVAGNETQTAIWPRSATLAVARLLA
ncbi:MAG: Gfo/Idh/MocA family oxidoreductase [Paracoccaceae bacterium]|nr:Gfo/Idh/MocA family oxidoreductase [Paracoccaceae bacterium]